MIHPAAPEHIPGYVASADGSDPLFTIMAIFAIVLTVGIGVMYLTLHSIPERMAHKASHPQMQIVGILALLALFTHNGMFWVAAIILAGFQFPDMLSPLQSMARSLGEMAGGKSATTAATPQQTPVAATATSPAEEH
ncbi:hypothetical protein [Pseudooceanicola algae]|uniref:Uncharacterized protein n=1 Tax=Pseudooceanicola algae TaxID=1537215 RepID=A0A418SHM7_9RHOB|nr:hypothetical protein [Pseudooceanicola algae]QPM90300.1 hypothetical protein PSAL_015350 [Pseudooceanicola algae]